MTDREKHLKVLETWKLRISKPTKNQLGYVEGWIHEDDLRALDYAISSIKTDLKYDLIYEGEEVCTKDDVVAMLTELLAELKGLPEAHFYETNEFGDATGCIDYPAISKNALDLIQQKINALKGENNGNR